LLGLRRGGRRGEVTSELSMFFGVCAYAAIKSGPYALRTVTGGNYRLASSTTDHRLGTGGPSSTGIAYDAEVSLYVRRLWRRADYEASSRSPQRWVRPRKKV
jgi:hypothetical protein